MKRNRYTHNHVAKTKRERDEYVKFVRGSGEDHTVPYAGIGTLRDDDEYSAPEVSGNSRTKRKNRTNRFIIHLKECWPNYAMGGIGALALFFFVTFNVKIAEINKDISYIYGKLDENTRRIEKVSDDIVLVGNNILTLDGGLKSLNDRFTLLIELFRQQGGREGD
jgi:hypothetical protein